MPTEPGYALAVIASKVFSRREFRGFLSGQGSTAFGSERHEQNVDIPVPHGRGRVGGRGLLGSHPGQSSTAFGAAEHFPVATAEQIVDIPVPRGGRYLHPAASSSGLPGTANQGVCRTFPRKKSAQLGPHPESELGADFTSSTSSAHSDQSTLCTGRLGLALVMRQPTDAIESMSCHFCSCSSHLESGALFPLSLYLAVIVPGVWVLPMSTRIGFFGR